MNALTKNQKLYGLLSILSLAGYAWVGYQYYAHEHQLHIPASVCMFKNITGIPCPSCGTTRSVLCLLHGDVSHAFLINPLGFMVLIIMIILPVWLLADVLTGSRSLAAWYQRMEITLKTKKLLYIPLVALIVANWGWNIFKDL